MNAGTLHGRVAAVHGTVLEIDVEGPVPPLSTALRCRLSDDGWVTGVVHGTSAALRVTAIAVDSTRGLRRGAEVWSDGLPLTTAVGTELLGRVVDLHGRPLDGGPRSPARHAGRCTGRRRHPESGGPGARCTAAARRCSGARASGRPLS